MSNTHVLDSLKALFKNKKGANITLQSGEVITNVIPSGLSQTLFGDSPTFTYLISDENGKQEKKTVNFTDIVKVESLSSLNVPSDVASSGDFWRSSIFSPMGDFMNQSKSSLSSSNKDLFAQSASSSDLFKPKPAPPVEETKKVDPFKENDPAEEFKKLPNSEHGFEDSSSAFPKGSEQMGYDPQGKLSKNDLFNDAQHKMDEKFGISSQQQVKEIQKKVEEVGSEAISKTGKITMAIFAFAVVAGLTTALVTGLASGMSGALDEDDTGTDTLSNQPISSGSNEDLVGASFIYKDTNLPNNTVSDDEYYSVTNLVGLTEASTSKVIPSSNNFCSAIVQNIELDENSPFYENGTTSEESSKLLAQSVYEAYEKTQQEAGAKVSPADYGTYSFASTKTGNEMEMIRLTIGAGQKTVNYGVTVIPSINAALVVSNNCDIDLQTMQDKLPEIDYVTSSK